MAPSSEHGRGCREFADAIPFTPEVTTLRKACACVIRTIGTVAVRSDERRVLDESR